MLARPFALLSVFALTLSAQVHAQQQQLRWKLRANDSLKYSVVQQMDSQTQFGDESVSSKFSQTIDMSWHILSSDANGGTVLNQVFDRVRLKMEGGPAGTIEFDTADRTPADNPVLKALSDVFSNIVGQEFQVRMTGIGKIQDVTVPPKLLAAVQKSAAGQQGALNEKMLKDMMKQSAVMLPETAGGPGSRWTTKQDVQMPFGTMTITSAMSYVGNDDNGNAVIDFKPSVVMTPREGAQAKMSLDESEGRGRIVFDIRNGRVSSSQLDLTMKMTMDVNGQKLPQTIRNRTAMTLAR